MVEMVNDVAVGLDGLLRDEFEEADVEVQAAVSSGGSALGEGGLRRGVVGFLGLLVEPGCQEIVGRGADFAGVGQVAEFLEALDGRPATVEDLQQRG